MQPLLRTFVNETYRKERERELESKLDETRNTLKREQVLLRELKIKMEDDYVPDVTEATESTSTSTSAAASKLKYPTDPNMYAEFQEFVSLAPSTKLAKMPNIPFLKNLIDDDILPTLRFGGNARTSTRKMLDAVAADLLTVQEMTPVQFSSWFSLNQTLKDALVVRSTHVSGGGTTTSNSVTTTVLAGKDVAVSPEASMPPPGVAATVSSYIPGLPRSRTPSEANVSPPVAAAPALNHEAQSAVSAVAAIAATASHSVFTKSIAERVSSWTLSESKAAADPLSNLPSFFVVSGCSTCGKICAIQHHFRINSSDGATVANTPTQPAAKKEEIEGWIPVCDNCFDRLDAVARFYAFVRVLRSGSFVGRSVEEMYAEVGAVKRDMFLSRIGGGGWNRRQGAQHQKGPAAGRAGRTASSSGLSFRQLGSVSRSSSEVLG
ncbi:hypothetical protein BC830DRAFT_889395 [Chytriomyces sp. MP71]|nr:hypothetical protein BC830DRAFT_889395 [Chytriomyces sp. MP71]